MALFDSLVSLLGGSGLLPSFAGEAQAQPQQDPTQPPPVGMLDRLGAGTRSFLGSSNPIEGMVNGFSGLASGKRTDPVGIQQEAVRGMINQLLAQRRITPTDAQFLAANPSAWGELSKAMINQPLTNVNGTVLQSGPFGRVSPVVEVPNSSNIQITNRDGSQSPGFAVAPNLGNPQGRIAVPGAQAQSQGPTAPNPNLPNGGQPLITQASPQATKEREGVGADLAAQYAEITKKASGATSRLSALGRMRQLSPAAYEGAGAPGLQLARSFLTTLGFPAGAVPAGEEFKALSNKLVLDANNGSLGPGVSNADVGFIKSIQPGMEQTKEGREMLIDLHTRLAKREQEVLRQATLYRKQNGSLEGFQVHIQEWAEKNPALKDMPLPPQRNATGFNDRFEPATGAPQPPKVGFRKGGFEFMGGDPAKPESWRRVDLQ